jgi:hypothetical protein
MNIRLTVPIALVAVLIRWILHANGTITDGFTFAPIHLLFLLSAVFLAGWKALKSEPALEVPGLFRAGFRAAAVYALIAAVFAYVLYAMIDPLFFPIRINAMIDAAVAQGRSEAEAHEKVEAFFSPFKYATITLAAFMVIGAVDAMVCALLHHKVLRKVMR